MRHGSSGPHRLRCELMFVSDGSRGTDGRGTVASASVDMLTRGLSRAIDALLDVDPDATFDGELADAMLGLRREQARLAAVVADLTAAFEARQTYAADGLAVGDRLDRGPRPPPPAAGRRRGARRPPVAVDARNPGRVPDRGHLRGPRAGPRPPGRSPPRRAALPRRRSPPRGRGAAAAVRRLGTAVRLLARRGRSRRSRAPPRPRPRSSPVPHRRRSRRRRPCRRIPHPRRHRGGRRGARPDRTRAVRRRLGHRQSDPRRRHHGGAPGADVGTAASRRPGRDGGAGDDGSRRREAPGPAGHCHGRLRHVRGSRLRAGGGDDRRPRHCRRAAGRRRDVDRAGRVRRRQPDPRHQLRPQLPRHPAPRPRRRPPPVQPRDLLRPRRPVPGRPRHRVERGRARPRKPTGDSGVARTTAGGTPPAGPTHHDLRHREADEAPADETAVPDEPDAVDPPRDLRIGPGPYPTCACGAAPSATTSTCIHAVGASTTAGAPTPPPRRRSPPRPDEGRAGPSGCRRCRGRRRLARRARLAAG